MKERLVGAVGSIDWWKYAHGLPIAIPLALVSFSLVAITLALVGQFKLHAILPLGFALVGAVTALFYRKYRPGVLNREAKVTTLAVLALFIGWTGFNAYFASQHVHTNRDPATYAVMGIYLSNQNDLIIETENNLKGVTGITEGSAGFNPNENFENANYAQGTHVLPALLGTVGAIFGTSALLHVNPLFGGIALLALFAFGRQLMRDRWALLAATVFSVSMPLLYFSRDTYTEPLTAAFVFGSLSMIGLASKYKHNIYWLLAGLLAGGSALVRIDAPLTILGLSVGVFWFVAINKNKRAWLPIIAYLAPVVALGIIAYLDVRIFSSGYFAHQEDNINALYIAYGVFLVAAIVSTITARKSTVFIKLLRSTDRWRNKAIAASVFLVGSLLAFRPFLYIGHRETGINLTAHLQISAGLPVDAFRDYSEQTVNWMIWYIGPISVLFALVGFIIAFRKMFTSRNVLWVTSIFTIFAVAILYFNKPSITPDQIWASRRFLPVVIPGLAVFGALGISWLYERRKKLFGLSSSSLALVFAVLAVTFPLMVSYPLIFKPTYSTQLAQVEAVCNGISDNSTVIWVGRAGLNLIAPVDAQCGINTYRIVDDSDATRVDVYKDAARIAETQGRSVYVGVYGNQLEMLPKEWAGDLEVVTKEEYEDYEQTLIRPPVKSQIIERSIYLGKINKNGSIGIAEAR